MRAALALALALLAAPAGAETVTRTFAPATVGGAKELAGAVAGRTVASGWSTSGSLRAQGAAALAADPNGNRALVVQRGDGHAAAVSQAGTGNALLLLQAGHGATADVAQAGGSREVVLQWGRPDPDSSQP